MRAFVVIVAFVVVACGPRDASIRRERAAAETRKLAATFDELEDRLVMTQARVRLWQELKARHESVSAVTCASLDSHAQEMAAHHVLPADGKSSLHRARVAAATTSAAAARVPSSVR